jgi:hypothetical protein
VSCCTLVNAAALGRKQDHSIESFMAPSVMSTELALESKTCVGSGVPARGLILGDGGGLVTGGLNLITDVLPKVMSDPRSSCELSAISIERWSTKACRKFLNRCDQILYLSRVSLIAVVEPYFIDRSSRFIKRHVDIPGSSFHVRLIVESAMLPLTSFEQRFEVCRVLLQGIISLLQCLEKGLISRLAWRRRVLDP